jgi:hypothetical protein
LELKPMNLEQLPVEIWEAVKAIGAALMPAAIGSAVAQAWQEGLSLRDRFIQWAVGICVSYYVTLGISAFFGLGQFAAQAVGFVVAMIAFQGTPKFIAGCSRTLESLPEAVRDRFLGGKK